MSHGDRLQTRSNKEAIFQSNSRFLSSTFGVNSATLIKLLSTELWFAKTFIFHSNITINDNLGKEMLSLKFHRETSNFLRFKQMM